MKTTRYIVTLFPLTLLVLTACDTKSSESDLQKLQNEFKQALSDAKESFGKLTTDQTKKLKQSATGIKDDANVEVEKLFTFEYLVEEIPKALPAKQIEERLAALGKERWECFQVREHLAMLQVFCRRRPKTYLRYVPRMFM